MDMPVLLIVDDEEHIVSSLKRSLRDLFTVLTAGSGSDALEILSHQKIDLILTDERMPGMTGVELLAQAFQIQPETFGIIISAYTDVEALTSALNLKNVRGFISKPWNIIELRSRLMEMLLDQNEHFINQVLDNTPDGITVFDRIEKRVVFANRGAEECLGYPVAEIKQMPGGYLHHLAHPDENLQVKQHLEILTNAPDNQIFELHAKYQHGNGEWRYLASWDRVLRRDANGSPRLILGTIRDITQTILSQEALRQANEHLETRVTERTAELVEEVNERRQAEAALEKNYSTLHSVIESADALIFSLDKYYCYTAFNHAHAQVMKTIYGQEIQPGQNILDLMSVAEDRISAQKNLDRCLAGEHLIEEAFSGEDGLSRLFFEVSHTPIITEAGEIIGVLVFSKDITARRQVEEALRASEARFRSAVTHAPFPIMLHAEDGKVELVNDEWCHITGYSPEEIPTTSAWTEKAYGSRKELVQADIDKLYSITEKIDEGEYVIRTKTGEKRYWYFSSTALGKTSDGRRLAMSIALDFTKRKLTEEALRESENRYQAIVDNLPNGIVHIFDRNFRYIFIAGEELHKLGLTCEMVLGKTIYEVHTPALASAAVERYRHVLTGENVRFSEEYSDCSFLVHAIPLRDENGEINRILVLSINVTELKHQEVKLNEQLEELRRWHAVMLGRESRIIDLKYEVNRLLEQIGLPPRYPSAEPEVH